MFGLNDPWIAGTYVLCILSALLCVVYGLMNWNKGADEERLQIKEQAVWEKAAARIEFLHIFSHSRVLRFKTGEQVKCLGNSMLLKKRVKEFYLSLDF